MSFAGINNSSRMQKNTEKTSKFESSTVLKLKCSCVFANVSGIVERSQESLVNPHIILSHAAPFLLPHYKKNATYLTRHNRDKQF